MVESGRQTEVRRSCSVQRTRYRSEDQPGLEGDYSLQTDLSRNKPIGLGPEPLDIREHQGSWSKSEAGSPQGHKKYVYMPQGVNDHMSPCFQSFPGYCRD